MKKLLLMGLLSVSLMSCSEDSSSPATFTGKGSDYLPTKSNELQTYQLSG